MSRGKIKSNVIALRIWQHATPIGWNCTLQDCAEALGVSIYTIAAVVRRRGWVERFRVSPYRVENSVGPFRNYAGRPRTHRDAASILQDLAPVDHFAEGL